MNIEEIEDKAFWCDTVYMKEPVVGLSDVVKIIDEHKGRICMNCRHYIVAPQLCHKIHLKDNSRIGEYFSCEMFEEARK